MIKYTYILFIVIVKLFYLNSIWAQDYVVGGDFDYPPFSFIDESGNAQGLDIDILNAISHESNVDFTYNLSSWDSALTSIQSGEIDIITGIIFSEERQEFVDFTTPIHTEYYSIFIRKGLPFKGISSLYDYNLIIVDKDISFDKYITPMGFNENCTLTKSFPQAFSEVEAGQADYVIAPYLLGMNEIEKNEYQNIEIAGPPIMPSIYCMAVKKGNTELLKVLNKGLLELRKNGKLSKIQNKWKVYERDDYKYSRMVKYIGLAVGISIVLLFLVFVWVWVLRNQIKKKTENLNQKNQELQQSEVQLIELNATKDKLFSIIAHDLRSPFNSIIGLSEILTKNVEDEKYEKIEEFSKIIQDSSQKAMDLLSNLMDWALSQTGQINFIPEKIELNKLINENILFFTDIVNQKSISISNEIQALLFVKADRAMLNTVIRNLISNAIKFTESGGKINISAEVKNNKVKISVSDTGVGIPKKSIDKIFGKDIQHSTLGTENEKGSGLGLMLCKEFIDKHHGEIWVVSKLGKGSVFHFTIPVDN